MNEARVKNVWWLLRITYTVVPIAAGIDKFFNFLTIWPQYVHPKVFQMIAVNPMYIMYAVAAIEISVGLLVFFKTRIGALVFAGWATGIAAMFIIGGGYYDIAVRDVVMAVGAYALAELTLDCGC